MNTKEHESAKVLIKTIRKFIRKDAIDNISNIVRKLHPADIAKITQNLAPDERTILIKAIIDLKLRAGTIEYLDDYTVAADILSNFSPKEIATILEKISIDKSVDIFEELDEEISEEVEQFLDYKFKEEMASLAKYPEDSAGGIMNPDFFAINKDLTVEEAIEQIRKASKGKRIIYVYVVNKYRHLIGVVTLRALITAEKYE